jgi:uncharacterized protein YecE (DUF72 family)
MAEFIAADKLLNKIKVGTSGWSYDDWIGPFYKSDEKSKWLDYYARFFNTVEINSTYYRIPGENVVNVWIEKSKRYDSFEYSMKFPKFYEISSGKEVINQFENEVVFQMYQNELLGAILIQLTPYVRRVERGVRTGNLERLDEFLGLLDTDSYNYFVEFRHASWLERDRQSIEHDTQLVLEKHKVGPCIVDGPPFPTLLPNGGPRSDVVYARLHGRNYEEWFKKHVSYDSLSRSARYDYEYTEDELRSWSEKIKKIVTEFDSKRIWVYFNNHPLGKAPRNALMLMNLLGISREESDTALFEHRRTL